MDMITMVERLHEAGMEEKVAKVLARKLEEVATKEDLGAVKVEIKGEFKEGHGHL